MKKKVLYIGGFNLPDKNAAAHRVIANSKIFRKLGCDVFLVGLSSDWANINTLFNYEGLTCFNIKYPETIFEWYKYLFTIHDYKKIIKQYNPDIIIAYNHPAYSLKCLYNYNKAHRIKTLSDCTEWYNSGGGYAFRLIKNWDVNYRMNVVHPHLDGIIVISSFLESFYSERGVLTLHLPPLVDKSEKKWDECTVEKNETKRLVYAGSTSRQKDRLDVIINLLSKVVQDEDVSLTFNILGLTSDQYRKMYLSADVIPPFVSFRGRVSHIEAIDELKKSDFQIFFRENNLINTAGFPTKFVETISSKCLVLTNKTSDLEDYLVDGINGFWIDDIDDKSIYSSLARALRITRNNLDEMRSKMDTNIFDYRNYVYQTECFLKHVFKND